MNDIAADLQRSLRYLYVATGMLYVMVFFILIIMWADFQQKRNALQLEAARTNQALCQVRSSLERRIVVTRNLLHLHPKGTRDLHPVVLRSEIANLVATVRALRVIECKRPQPVNVLRGGDDLSLMTNKSQTRKLRTKRLR